MFYPRYLCFLRNLFKRFAQNNSKEKKCSLKEGERTVLFKIGFYELIFYHFDFL